MLAGVRKLFGKKSVALDSRIDRLTYAIGDIHGMYRQFCLLLDRVRADAETFNVRPRVLLLGDYIDRGIESAKVLDHILVLEAENRDGRGWCDLEILIGNHEVAMMNFLSGASGSSMWLKYGGDTTLASYGIVAPTHLPFRDLAKYLREELDRKLPMAHRALIRRMEMTFQAGDYLFVHAGVSPSRPLAEQGEEEFLWIRNEFLASQRACEFVVVHGHTPTTEPVNMRWRIGVDTGAYETGILTAVRLVEGTREFISVPSAH